MQQWWEAIVGSGVVVALLGWLGIRTVRRIDVLEREKADREAIRDLVDEFRDHAKETRTSLGKVHTKLDTTISSVNDVGQRVAHLEGRLGNNGH